MARAHAYESFQSRAHSAAAHEQSAFTALRGHAAHARTLDFARVTGSCDSAHTLQADTHAHRQMLTRIAEEMHRGTTDVEKSSRTESVRQEQARLLHLRSCAHAESRALNTAFSGVFALALLGS